MKVIRLLIYEGKFEELQRQLGNSLSDGVMSWNPKMSITVFTFNPAYRLRHTVKSLWKAFFGAKKGENGQT
jgi:hypothetical protein